MKKRASRKRVWSWADEPPPGAVSWLRDCFRIGQESEERYNLQRLERVKAGSEPLGYMADQVANHGRADRKASLLSFVLMRMPLELRTELEHWIDFGGPAMDQILERLRASEVARVKLFEALHHNGRTDEARAVMDAHQADLNEQLRKIVAPPASPVRCGEDAEEPGLSGGVPMPEQNEGRD